VGNIARAWPRLSRFREQRGDAVLAGVMSVAGLLEAASSYSRSPLTVLLATVPLAWRGRWPLPVLALVFLGAVLSDNRGAPIVEITAAAIAAYSVGAHEQHRVLGIGALTAMAFIILLMFGGRLPPLPDFAGPFVIVLPLWLAGNGIRQSRMRAEAMAERARTLESEKELNLKLAQDEERARLARELHDVVAHSVSVMVVQAGAARQVVAQAPDRALAALLAVEETGRDAMRELRQILGVLGDTDADFDPQPGLGQLNALVETVREAGLPVELEIVGLARPLPPGLELTAYRVVQEALTNALKHSGMAATRVAVEYRALELTLEVLSNGSEAVHPSSEGRGLRGMKERILLLGGRMEAGPGVDRGYSVRVWLPLNAA
jgi:signal transduction histidine kinase